MQLLYY